MENGGCERQPPALPGGDCLGTHSMHRLSWGSFTGPVSLTSAMKLSASIVMRPRSHRFGTVALQLYYISLYKLGRSKGGRRQPDRGVFGLGTSLEEAGREQRRLPQQSAHRRGRTWGFNARTRKRAAAPLVKLRLIARRFVPWSRFEWGPRHLPRHTGLLLNWRCHEARNVAIVTIGVNSVALVNPPPSAR